MSRLLFVRASLYSPSQEFPPMTVHRQVSVSTFVLCAKLDSARSVGCRSIYPYLPVLLIMSALRSLRNRCIHLNSGDIIPNSSVSVSGRASWAEGAQGVPPVPFLHQRQICVVVLLAEEDLLAAVAALRDVMRRLRHDHSGHPRHTREHIRLPAVRQELSIMSPDPRSCPECKAHSPEAR